MELFRRSLDYEPEGSYVTPDRVKKIEDVLTEDEKILYLIRCWIVELGDEDASSGDDRTRISSKGWPRMGITDQRIVVKIPQRFGKIEQVVPYEDITDVDLFVSIERAESGFTYKKNRLTLRTPNWTYYAEIDSPDSSECREAIRFVREKIDEVSP